MNLDWAAVRARYTPGTTLPSLAGTSVLEVVSVDDTELCLRQRLWRACITRDELTTALGLLRPGMTARELAEAVRRYYAGGDEVRTGCTRTPNLAAVVLSDLGYL